MTKVYVVNIKYLPEGTGGTIKVKEILSDAISWVRILYPDFYLASNSDIKELGFDENYEGNVEVVFLDKDKERAIFIEKWKVE